MITFAQLVKKASSRTSKPRLAIAPAQDAQLLKLLPEIEAIAEPVLIGDLKDISSILSKHGNSLDRYDSIDETDPTQAILKARNLIIQSQANILVQGAISNPILRDIILCSEDGLEPHCFLSHISVLESRQLSRLVLITDSMINRKPVLKDKISILNNALNLTKAIGIDKPRVAALAALEYVNPSIQSTIDAAVLSKMADRHQFADTIVEGPLDIDCAVSSQAAGRKNVSSRVGEEVDIYLVSDVESGNSFAQFMSLLGSIPMAGIIVGARAPIIVNMPYITNQGKIVEIALASLLYHYKNIYV
ncbi:MAG: hypothetical protein JW920_06910 [Deltaproteobacteria bacterium]|nr:hypothetical protein [Deltaproteobacteria bacterium]